MKRRTPWWIIGWVALSSVVYVTQMTRALWHERGQYLHRETIDDKEIP